MNVEKLLARLNAPTAQYGVQRGGTPDLTAQDIAAAVGMVQDEFAREVFCAIWWDAGAFSARERALKLLAVKQRSEIARQWRKVQILRLELHIAIDDLAARRRSTQEDRDAVERIRERIEKAKVGGWPTQKPERYASIRFAAMAEIKSPKHCRGCDGRGTKLDGGLVKQCIQCDGRGIVPVTDKQRAIDVGLNESEYRKSWKQVYDWTYSEIANAESVGRTAIKRCLGNLAA